MSRLRRLSKGMPYRATQAVDPAPLRRVSKSEIHAAAQAAGLLKFTKADHADSSDEEDVGQEAGEATFKRVEGVVDVVGVVGVEGVEGRDGPASDAAGGSRSVSNRTRANDTADSNVGFGLGLESAGGATRNGTASQNASATGTTAEKGAVADSWVASSDRDPLRHAPVTGSLDVNWAQLDQHNQQQILQKRTSGATAEQGSPAGSASRRFSMRRSMSETNRPPSAATLAAASPSPADSPIVQWLDKAADLDELLTRSGHGDLGALLSSEGTTAEHRQGVYTYLEQRLSKLSVESLAVVLQAIQHVNVPEPSDHSAVLVIFRHTRGDVLTNLKHAVDCDDDKDLLNLVYNFLNPITRTKLLAYFATQAAKQPQRRNCIHVVSDLDDTFVHSGLGLGGPKWPKGTVMPGVVKLFTTMQAKIVFLTARPDWQWILRFTKKTVRETYGLRNAGIMLGKLRDSVLIPFTKTTANQLIARRKLENYKCVKALYPECCFIWLGDTGQADVQVGLQMLSTDNAHRSVLGCFIQDVSLEDGRRLKTSMEERLRLDSLGVSICNNYIDVATVLHDRGVLDDAQLAEVAKAVIAESIALQEHYADALIWQARASELQASLETANARLLAHNANPVLWPEP